MSLFQVSVLKKHLKLQEKEVLDKAYKKYAKYFLNTTIQENIRSSKEEEYQGIFLTELFVNILDYTLKPNADFNLVAEYKNQTNARKADGAILNDSIAIAVIELKGTKTKDLESIRKQAFDYKANQKGCIYVITSNFEKLRFYINDATEFEEFNLFELTKQRFELLYLCLQKDNIINNIPLKIKEASVVKEEQITKEFYKDYSLFKRELYRDLVKQNLKNPIFRIEQEKEDIDSINKNIKLSLFKKSQKLIDRFLFIFFAEDRGLLPPNSTLQILENWDKLKDLDVEVPLYNRFKLYFKYLDTGREGTDKKAEIFAYNGGLFKPDAVLNSLILDDTLLYKHTKKLSEYDFDSQVDVNILGHIFENSLNEIESVNAEIQGSNFDKQTSKRKKDGVFYTPKYITKYIVDNTVGKLCTEKKIELGIKEDDYFKGRKNRQKATIIKLVSFLDVYREWLLKLTICDPACGSGAFLNQTLDFLIKEHAYIDELQTKVLGGGFQFPDIENTILENNIFGVDLNEESVEIAKLSMWLRTAQPRRKLNNLNSNIKCGNSLIDSKSVAGDKAFKWENEFPQIFEKKSKKLYLVTFVTHNSRISDRMVEFNPPEFVKELQPFYFENEDYSKIIDLIATGIQKYKIPTVQFTVLPDHIHLLVSAEDEKIVTEQIRKLKGYTSFEFQRYKNWNKSENNLWAQKFHKKEIDIEANKITSVISYIENNLEKHTERWFDSQGGNGLKPVASDIEGNLSGNGLKPVVDVESETNNGLQPIALQEFITDKLKKLNKEICVSYQEATQNNGGFDVVIGNPPYVRKQGLMEHYPEMCNFYEKKYQSATANYDIYALFMEKCYHLINSKGIVSFILPHKFLVSDFGAGIRQFFKENKAVESVLHFGSDMVFADASTYTCIINLEKSEKNKVLFKKINPYEISNYFDWDYMLYENLDENNWDLQSQKIFDTIDKLKKQKYTVADVFDNIFQGLATSLDAVYVFKGEDKGNYIKGYNEKYDYHFEIEKEIVKPIFGGRDIFKYETPTINNYVIFPYLLEESSAKPMTENYISENLPKAYTYLKHFEKEIKGRERGRMDIDEGWFLYIYPKNLPYFQNAKIMTREISLGCNMTYDEKGEFYHNTKVYSFIKKKDFDVDEKYYLGIMNSKVMWFFLKNTGSEYRGGYYVFKTNYLKPFPLPEISENSQEIIDKVNLQLENNKVFQKVNNNFQNYLKQKFQLEKLSKKLQNWYELEFGYFIKELNKAIKSNNKELVKNELPIIPILTKLDEMDWMDVFTVKKAEAQALQTQINQTDTEIDAMVYELYNLTEAEIAIVENS